MATLFSSGRIVDVVLALMLVELAALWIAGRRGLAGFRLLGLVFNGAAGAGLLLALRASLRGAPWQAISLWLLAALGFHLADLSLRVSWRRRDGERR